jgi:hypothetical protein
MKDRDQYGPADYMCLGVAMGSFVFLIVLIILLILSKYGI